MAHSGWRVTQQVTDQIINTQAGLTQTGVQVYYATGEGNEGSVFVPNQQYKEHVVRGMLEAGATLLDTIGKMSGEAKE